jgi:GNAT superfamily N-acetyltransferase
MTNITLRPALPSDASDVAACVCEAYVQYIERIGKQPGPMLEDYARVINDAMVYVAIRANHLVGVIVLMNTEEGFYVDNVAVRPTVKGTGVGRMLLQFAESEAKRRGYASIYLATHELMVENRALYRRTGYVECEHRVVNGYPRVFFRKVLP